MTSSLVPDTAADLVGGRYRLLELIGAGGMGRVWLAQDELLQRRVAVKEIVIPEDIPASELLALQMRTMREARAAARLDHPHLVGVFDVIWRPDRSWIVLEYVPSRSLHQVIRDNGPLKHREAAKIGLGVLRALRAAHGAGVLHRDVKPQNVLIADDGRVVLTDFGVATFAGAGGTADPVMGSPLYIAPERLRSTGAGPGPAADLWSLGATLYAAVEGRPPFRRLSTVLSLTALIKEPPDPPRHPGPLHAMINDLLVKDPARRMTAEDAEEALRRIAERTVGIFRPPQQRRLKAPPPDGSPVIGRATATATPSRPVRRRFGFAPASATGSEAGNPGRAGLGRIGLGRVGLGRVGLGRIGLGRVGLGRVGLGRVGLGRVGLGRARPDRAGLDRAELGRARPDRAGLDRAELGRARPDRAGLDRAELDRAELDWAELDRAGSVRAGSDRAGSDRAGSDRAGLRRAGLRRVGTGVAVAAVLAGAGAAAAILLPSEERPVFIPAVTAAGPAAAVAPVACGAGGALTPRAGTPPYVLPSGWIWHSDPAGFDLALPGVWTRSALAGGACFADTLAAGAFTVDTRGPATPLPLQHWQATERAAVADGSLPGYERVGMGVLALKQGGADWEYSWQPATGPRMHVRRVLLSVDGGGTYLLQWTTPAASWTATVPMQQRIVDSIRPS